MAWAIPEGQLHQSCKETIGTFRATEQRDLPELSKFLVRVYKFEPSDFHFDPKFLAWKYLDARDGWQGGRSYLLKKDRKIVAHAGVCPVSVQLPNGGIVSSLTITDWGADPTTPLMGVTIFRKLMTMAPTCFVIGGADVTRQILPRIGFRRVAEAVTYAAWLHPWQEFRSHPRTRRSALRLLHGLTHPARNRRIAGSGWDFAPVDQFDDSLLPILSGTRLPWTRCQRSVADLNYLLKCPHARMRGFLLTRQGQLAGYFIIGRADWEARLLDIALDSGDASDWKSAYAMVTRVAMSDASAARIRVLATAPMLSDALKWNGYWRQYEEPIALYDPEELLGQAFPVSFQLFDGDSAYIGADSVSSL